MSALANVKEDRRTLTVTLKELRHKVLIFGELLDHPPTDAGGWSRCWRQLAICADTLSDLARAYASDRGDANDSEVLAWVIMLADDVHSHLADIESLMPWIHFVPVLETAESKPEQPLLALDTPLNQLPDGYTQALADLGALPGPANADHKAKVSALLHAKQRATSLIECLGNMAARLDALFYEMDFHFLYDTDRHMFAIGYRVAEGVIDPSYYDLLASEARLSSIVAIAKRDVPNTHWFHLGRRVTRAAQGIVLLSWSGSMFEYLMPSLVTFTPRYSLLDQTC